ncbi:MAG: peptide ABC transporter permease, partial [Bacteroidetes bacterium]
MFSYTLRRMFSLIPVLIGMTLIVFAIIHAIPGNPAQVILGQRATREAVAALTQQLGLDRPWYIQYFDYLKALFHGDLGISLRTRGQINQEIWPYLAATIELTAVAMIIAVIVGVNAGIIS